MGVMLDKLKAYHDLAADQDATGPVRVRLSDADALALVEEVGPANMTHAVDAARGAALLTASLAEPQPPSGDDLGAYVDRRREALRVFWEAVHGQLFNGVEVVRKPA